MLGCVLRAADRYDVTSACSLEALKRSVAMSRAVLCCIPWSVMFCSVHSRAEWHYHVPSCHFISFCIVHEVGMDQDGGRTTLQPAVE